MKISLKYMPAFLIYVFSSKDLFKMKIVNYKAFYIAKVCLLILVLVMQERFVFFLYRFCLPVVVS